MSGTATIGPGAEWVSRTLPLNAAPFELRTRVRVNDPESVCRCAILGLGIAFVATLNTVQHLRNGTLVRVLPDWYADIGPISLYFSAGRQLPAKTRAFVDYIVTECRRRDLSGLLAANNSDSKSRA